MIQLTKAQIKEIVEELDCGFKCFYNKKTSELVYTFQMDDGYLKENEENLWEKDIREIEANPDNYFEIKKMGSSAFFSVMEDFIELVDNKKIKNQLSYTLEKKKPFREFKAKIKEYDEYLDKWYKFKEEKAMDWVEYQINNFEDEEEL